VREIQERTGAYVNVRREIGAVEVSGGNVAAAAAEIRRIVEDGKRNDVERGGSRQGGDFDNPDFGGRGGRERERDFDRGGNEGGRFDSRGRGDDRGGGYTPSSDARFNDAPYGGQGDRDRDGDGGLLVNLNRITTRHLIP
jgi:hypothetical protein